MKRKHLALLLAAALTVTSVDGTAFMVNAADFTAESSEAEAQSDETSETVVAENETEADFDAENAEIAEIEDGRVNSEVTEEADGDEITAENENEISDEAAIADEDEVQVEGEEDFTSDAAGDEAKTVQSVTLDTSKVKKKFAAGVQSVCMENLVAIVTYSDNTEGQITFNNTASKNDDYGNNFYYTLRRKTDQQNVDVWSYLDAGEYECVFFCNWKETGNKFDVSVVAPEQTSDYKGTLNVGDNKDVNSPLEGEAIYKFAPGAGRYYYPEYMPTTCDVWLKSGDNFARVYEHNLKLKDNETVYFIFSDGVSVWDNETETYVEQDKFDFQISRPAEIESVNIPGDSIILTKPWESTTANSSFINAEIKYKDKEYTNDYSLGLEGDFTEEGHDFKGKVVNKDGSEFNWADNDHTLPAGEYTYVFSVDDEPVIQKPLIIKEEGYDKLPVFNKGIHNLKLDGNRQWFKYEVPEATDTDYHLRIESDSVENPSARLHWYKLNDENKIDESDESTWTDIYSYGGASITLEAGAKYLFAFTNSSSECDSENVSLEFYTEIKAKSVKITDSNPEGPVNIVKGMDPLEIITIEAEVQLSNGINETLTYSKNNYDLERDKYGNALGWRLFKINEDGTRNKADKENPEAGKYELQAYYGKVNDSYEIEEEEDTTYSENSIIINILPLGDLDAVDMTENKTASSNDTDSRINFSFTPAESARYRFDFNVRVSGKILDSDGNILNQYGDEDGIYYVDANLKAEKKYYISVEASDSDCGDVQASVKRVETPLKLTAKLLKDNQTYLEDFDTYWDIPIEVTVTYLDENGKEKSRVIRPFEEFSDMCFYYRVSPAETSDSSDGSDDWQVEFDSGLNAGTWKIAPYFPGMQTEVQSEPVTVTVTELDTKKIDELTVNKWTEIKSTKRKFCKFIAPEDGEYEFAFKGNAKANLYYYDEVGDWSYLYDQNLRMGQCYVAVVTAYEDSEVMLRKYEKPEINKEEKAYTLTDGFKEKLPIDKYENYSFKFTPKADGKYKLDWQVEMDEDGEDYEYNLCVICDGEETYVSRGTSVELKAGKTYEYKLSITTGINYISSMVVSFQKVVHKQIKKIELVPIAGKEWNVTVSLYDAYKAKITYADNTTTTVYYSSDITDDYDNHIYADENIETTKNGETATVTFSYQYSESEETVSFPPVKVSTREISSYKEIQLGQKVSPLKDMTNGDCAFYRFNTPKAGRYLFNLSTGDNSESSIEVWHWTEENGWDSLWYDSSAYNLRVYNLKTAGEYLIKVTDLDELADKDCSLTVTNGKKLRSVEVIQEPSKKYVYRGFENEADLTGLKVKAVYDDKSEEIIEYGKHDSIGNEIEENDVVTFSSTARISIRVGEYRTYVDLELKDTNPDTMQKAEIGQETKVDMKGDNVAFVKFVPTEDGYYGLHVNNTVGAEWIYRARDQKKIDTGEAYLEVGETYYIRLVSYATPVVKLMKGVCNWVETEKPATCTEEGENSRTCTTHGVVEKDIIKAYGHKFGAWKVTKQPTCGVAGTEERTCSVCKTVEKRAIAATGKHKYGSWKTTKEATVLTAGQQERSCSVCGKKEISATAKLKATIEMNVSGTIPLKRKQTFNVKVTTGKGDKVVSWKSSNKKVVSVSKNGKIKGLKAGKTATITVQLQSGLKASFKVKVQKKAVATKSIKVTNASTGKNVGKKFTMKAKGTLKLAAAVSPVTSKQKVTYSSSNKKVATVTSKGVVKAKKKGKVTITVKSGKKSYKIKITVK